MFINKNVIECLALLALASMPTGRWMGLDALIQGACCRRNAYQHDDDLLALGDVELHQNSTLPGVDSCLSI